MQITKRGDGSLVVEFGSNELVTQLDFLEGRPLPLAESPAIEEIKQVIRVELAFPAGVDYTTMIQ